jgi:hypothetical protein
MRSAGASIASVKKWVGAHRFATAVGIVAAVGLTLRLVYLFAASTVIVSTDGEYYRVGANLLAQGHGFVDVLPYSLSLGRVWLPGAEHPPAFLVVLSIPSLLGLDTKLPLQIIATLIGTGTIPLMACAGRRLAGPRAGLIAAVIAALYPGFWLYEAQLLPETLAIFAVALVILLALQFRARPTWLRALAVGAVCGVLALTRTEMVLLVPFLLIPLTLLTPDASWKRRLLCLGAGAAAAAIVIMPWVAFNVSRFDKQVLITTQSGRTLAASNCDAAYNGPLLGSEVLTDAACSRRAGLTTWRANLPADVRKQQLDASWEDAELNKLAREYIDGHRQRLLVVVPAREGRTWGLFRPFQQLRLDLIHGNITFLRLEYFAYLLMLPFAIGGAVVLRRRGGVLSPMLAVIATVAVAVVATYGSNRYRAPADVAIALLAAVAVDAVLRALSRRLSGRPPESEERPSRSRGKRRKPKLLPITR